MIMSSAIIWKTVIFVFAQVSTKVTVAETRRNIVSTSSQPCTYTEETNKDIYNETISFLHLNNCSGKEVHNIASKALNSSSYIRRLELNNFREELDVARLAGFSVVELKVSYHKYISRSHNTSYLKYVQDLQVFELTNAFLSPLPDTGIGAMTLHNGASKSLGACMFLTNLTLISWDLRLIPDKWLANCSIVHLKIEHQPLNADELKKAMKNGVTELRELTIRHCLLDDINTELSGADKLVKLDLSHNQLHHFLLDTTLPSLRELDVSHNHLFGSALLASGVTSQLSLSVLVVDDNPYFTLCDVEEYAVAPYNEFVRLHQPLKGRMLTLQSLTRASFRQTSTTSICLSRLNAPQLSYFDLGDNHIDTVQLLGLPSTEKNLTINVSGNQVYQFPFEQDEYERLKQLSYKLNLTGFSHKVDCDCQSFWLSRAVSEGLLRADVKCADGRNLGTVPPEQTHCEKIQCAKGCICRRAFNTTDTVAECRDLTALPEDLVDLLWGSDYNITVRELDLTRSRINRLNLNETDALFRSNVSRRVLLAGNPILCDCHSEDFIAVLQENSEQIPDYDLLTCLDETTLIRDVNPHYLCFEPLHHRRWFIILLAFTVSLASLAILCTAAYCRYKKEIKIYLYARRLCLCCVKETELDSDREFDAFVSFSHKDEKFVIDQFLPIIDKDYKICVHYRDWIAGEMIPTQIVNSVSSSRRTIIILSKNFVDSIWGLLEFKTAHVSALREGRVRVIIVVLDDIIDDPKLDVELKNYLRTNTYIKFGDPWFWKKLFYAMPHVPLEKDFSELIGIDNNIEILDNEVEEKDNNMAKLVVPKDISSAEKDDKSNKVSNKELEEENKEFDDSQEDVTKDSGIESCTDL